MIPYFLRNSEDILYEGFLEISRPSKILLIKNYNFGNLLELIVFSLLSRMHQTFINASISLEKS